MDIVGYSKLPIDKQRDLIEELTKYVSISESYQSAVSNNAVIALPTGDGMALVFLEEPDAPARCAIEICRLMTEGLRIGRFPLRMGLHGGMVFRIKDINGRDNVAGAGINIGQRIMDLGDEGHVLCSEKLADDLQHYSDLAIKLTVLGECEVKHGVTVSVMNITGRQVGNEQLPVVFAKQVYASLNEYERIIFHQLLGDSHRTELQLKQAVGEHQAAALALERLKDIDLIDHYIMADAPAAWSLSARGSHVAQCNGLRAKTDYRRPIGFGPETRFG